MVSTLTSTATIDTLADLLEQLGGLAPDRVRFRPPPGTATEKDVLEVEAHEDRLCELVDGVLVEKAMGWRESILAIAFRAILWNFVRPRNLALIARADGPLRSLLVWCVCPTWRSSPGIGFPVGVFLASQSQIWRPILPWKC